MNSTLREIRGDTITGLFYNGLRNWHIIHHAHEKLGFYETRGLKVNSKHDANYKITAFLCAIMRLGFLIIIIMNQVVPPPT